jgi:transcriptional regulator with XRE-family HTH domain
VAQRSQAHTALGRAIRDYRQGLAISQEELAHRTGMHRTYLGGIERGERNPSFTNITRLADALGLRPSELLSVAERLQEEPPPR